VWGHIERFGQCDKQCAGVVRIFEDGKKFGDPYVYDFPFTMLDDRTIVLHGIIGKEQGGRAPTVDEARAGMKACHAAGLRIVRERHTGARQGTREITRRFEGK
jgi:hypothetical protein